MAELGVRINVAQKGNRPVLHVVENKVGPRKEDVSYGCLVVDWITQIMLHDPTARKWLYSESELWKSGAMLKVPVTRATCIVP